MSESMPITLLPTLPPNGGTSAAAPGHVPDRLAWAVVWCREEPERVGEVLFPPLTPDDPACLVGRGGASPSGLSHVEFLQQRPGWNIRTGFPKSPRISRTQLRLYARQDHQLEVENVGQCPLLWQGKSHSRVMVSEGGLLELQNELILLAVRRPAVLPGSLGDLVPQPRIFGRADTVNMVGESPALWELRRAIAFYAPLEHLHVLIQGSSGAGKELVAHALHQLSSRRDKVLVSRSAATFTETLADAELFGTAKDFPNKGVPERPGLIGEADHSTLFLDEIGDLPESLQVKLLRVLDQAGEFQRLGDARSHRADFRLVAATHRADEVLRHDMLARFKGRIQLPDLNNRREDIPLLVRHLLEKIRLQTERAPGQPGSLPGILTVSPALLRALLEHPYTTHIRELESLLWLARRESTGTCLELTPGVMARLAPSARTLEPAVPAPSAPTSPAPVPMAGVSATFTHDELATLTILRAHDFSASRLAQDPAYPGNRQHADLQMRQLFARALVLAGWDVLSASHLLAGDAGLELEQRLVSRLKIFLHNLEARVQTAQQVPGGLDALHVALGKEYKRARGDVWQVVEWMKGS